jgi:DNA-binding beta-propeller fold protein YncE
MAACGGGSDFADARLPDPDSRAIDARVDEPDARPDAQPDAMADASPDAQPDAAVSADAAPDANIPPDANVPPDAAPDANVPPDATATLCTIGPFTSGVSTLAGCAVAGADDGARDVARFANPGNVLRGPDGDLYVADFDNHRVRVVDADGNVRTLTAQANFIKPFGLAFTPDGTLYVSTDDNDSGQHSSLTGTIWRIDLETGDATVVIRDIGRPRGLAALDDGRLVLADYVHQTVRLLDPAGPTLTNLAGTFDQSGWVDDTGAAARFAGPYDVGVLPDDSIVVTDLFNHRIRRVTLAGVVTTIAGTGEAGDADGAALTVAQFHFPQGIAVDADGAVYVSDMENYTIRRLVAGEVTTIAGDGTAGFLDHDDLRSARFHGMEGIDVAPDGSRLWVADGSRGEDVPFHRVRVVQFPSGLF